MEKYLVCAAAITRLYLGQVIRFASSATFLRRYGYNTALFSIIEMISRNIGFV